MHMGQHDLPNTRMRMGIPVCTWRSPWDPYMPPYAYGDPYMHTGIPICIWGDVMPYAYGDPQMHTGISLCTQVSLFAYQDAMFAN
jgi:hypothetical protein